MKRYYVSAISEDTYSIEVSATNEEEAIKKARELSDDNWDLTDSDFTSISAEELE